MSFEETDKVLGAGFFRLKDDGDSGVVILLGEPMPRVNRFQGKKRTQACFPVLTEAGVQVWSMGPQLYTRIKKRWKSLLGKTITVTRIGEKGDMATKYDLKPSTPNAKWKDLLKKVDRAEVAESLTTATASGTDADDDDYEDRV